MLGGVRSGKSAFAERLIADRGSHPVYIATAQAFDVEMAARIAIHRKRRGDGWRLVEAPLGLPGELAARGRRGQPVIVDSLGLWMTNLLLAEHDLGAARAELCQAVRACEVPLCLVSDEVGLGGVPPNALARRFADELGLLHQEIAATVEEVVLVVAGLPLWLKR